MPASKAQQRATNKYISKAYDRINVTTPKGKKETIQAHAAALGESVNGFINRAINQTMEQDTARSPSEALGEPVDDLTTTIQPIPRGTLEIVESAAKAAGEKPGDFISRAVATQAKRDEMGRKMKGGKASE